MRKRLVGHIFIEVLDESNTHGHLEIKNLWSMNISFYYSSISSNHSSKQLQEDLALLVNGFKFFAGSCSIVDSFIKSKES